MRSERVLVWLKPQFLGDAVMATPLIDALAASFNRPNVSVGPNVATLLQDRFDRINVVPAAASRRYRDFWRHVKNARAGGYDIAVLVNRSFRSALISKLAGIKDRVGHRAEWRGPLLTKAVPYSQVRAEAECFLDLGRAIGIEATAPRIYLQVTDEERVGGNYFGKGQWVGIQPGARNDWKLIPMETLAAVAQGLRRQGFKIALFGGTEEADRAIEFAHHVSGDVLNLVGKCALRQTMGAVTHLRLMVGADTGLMHVAAALDCPTLTVFGRVPASKWGHNYEPHIALQAPGKDLAAVGPDVLLDAAQHILGRECLA